MIIVAVLWPLLLHTTYSFKTDPEQWLKDMNYERNVRPNVTGDPVIVDVHMYIMNIGQISELTMSFEVDFFMDQYWTDSRLELKDSDQGKLQTNLYEGLEDFFWQPDTYFPTAMPINGIQSDPKSPTHKRSLQLYPKGQLWKSERYSLVVRCPMYLVLFPFDRQICHITVESYLHPIDELLYRWRSGEFQLPVEINSEMKMPEMKLVDVKPIIRNFTYSAGVYCHLECCFYFERRIGYYFILLFIPTIGVASLCWISLSMSKETSFNDIMGVILSMIMLSFFRYMIMPRVSYVKADDLFVQICFLFVFVSLLKLGIEKKLEKNHKNKKHYDNVKNTNDKEQQLMLTTSNQLAITTGNKKLSVDNICVEDKKCSTKKVVCDIFLPCLFAIFCVVYFAVYLLMDNYQGDTICPQ